MKNNNNNLELTSPCLTVKWGRVSKAVCNMQGGNAQRGIKELEKNLECQDILLETTAKVTHITLLKIICMGCESWSVKKVAEKIGLLRNMVL